MIEGDLIKGYWLTCDNCGEGFDFETFDDAVDYKKREWLEKRKI